MDERIRNGNYVVYHLLICSILCREERLGYLHRYVRYTTPMDEGWLGTCGVGLSSWLRHSTCTSPTRLSGYCSSVCRLCPMHNVD